MRRRSSSRAMLARLSLADWYVTDGPTGMTAVALRLIGLMRCARLTVRGGECRQWIVPMPAGRLESAFCWRRVSALVVDANTSAVTILLPAIGEDLNAPIAQLQWAVTGQPGEQGGQRRGEADAAQRHHIAAR